MLSACLVVTGAHAESLTGRVVGITDGDTLTVLVTQQQLKVRLADIDAPESKQAFGSPPSLRSRSGLCGGSSSGGYHPWYAGLGIA